MRILSIDAWGNEEDGYEWNAWHTIASISKEEFEDLEKTNSFIQYFIDNGFVADQPEKLCIDDDGFNIVLSDANTHQPLFAIEYGTEY